MPVRKAKPVTKVSSHTRRTPAGKRAQVANSKQECLQLDQPAGMDAAIVLSVPKSICENAASMLDARGETYENGSGERQFHKVATAFSAITGIEIEGHHAALILQLTKLCRMENFYQTNGSLHYDSAVDGAAYVALTADEISRQAVDKADKWEN